MFFQVVGHCEQPADPPAILALKRLRAKKECHGVVGAAPLGAGDVAGQAKLAVANAEAVGPAAATEAALGASGPTRLTPPKRIADATRCLRRHRGNGRRLLGSAAAGAPASCSLLCVPGESACFGLRGERGGRSESPGCSVAAQYVTGAVPSPAQDRIGTRIGALFHHHRGGGGSRGRWGEWSSRQARYTSHQWNYVETAPSPPPPVLGPPPSLATAHKAGYHSKGRPPGKETGGVAPIDLLRVLALRATVHHLRRHAVCGLVALPAYCVRLGSMVP